MVLLFNFLGTHASLFMAIGCVSAVFMPKEVETLLPMLPVLIVLMLALSIARIDLIALWRQMSLKRFTFVTLFCGAMMLIAPFVFYFIGKSFGASDALLWVMVYFGVAPPIATCIAFALLLGANSLFALEVVIVGSILAPFIGPFVIGILFPNTSDISSIDLLYRLTGLVVFCLIAGFLYRLIVGGDRLERNATAYDGAFVTMTVLFVFPLFSGFIETVQNSPWHALKVAMAAYAVSLGMQLISFFCLKIMKLTHGTAASGAMLWGNRNLAIYFAILPIEPVFILFMAFYQFSILFTPLIFGRLYRG